MLTLLPSLLDRHLSEGRKDNDGGSDVGERHGGGGRGTENEAQTGYGHGAGTLIFRKRRRSGGKAGLGKLKRNVAAGLQPASNKESEPQKESWTKSRHRFHSGSTRGRPPHALL